MYAPGPNEKELASFGLTLDDVATEPIEIWPDNLQAFELFNAIMTQWRTGAAGATGLDHNVLYHRMDRMDLASERYVELESEIRIMEIAALDEMARR